MNDVVSTAADAASSLFSSLSVGSVTEVGAATSTASKQQVPGTSSAAATALSPYSNINHYYQHYDDYATLVGMVDEYYESDDGFWYAYDQVDIPYSMAVVSMMVAMALGFGIGYGV